MTHQIKHTRHSKYGVPFIAGTYGLGRKHRPKKIFVGQRVWNRATEKLAVIQGFIPKGKSTIVWIKYDSTGDLETVPITQLERI